MSVFLQIEVRVFAKYILEKLNLVIEYGSEYEEFNGNICGVEMRSNYTRIYDNLAEDGKGNWCEIETKELKELIDMWLDKCEKYTREGKIETLSERSYYKCMNKENLNE